MTQRRRPSLAPRPSLRWLPCSAVVAATLLPLQAAPRRLPTGSLAPRRPLDSSSLCRLTASRRSARRWCIQRSPLDEADILHWYHFIMVAVPLNATPKAVVRWEGIEFAPPEDRSEDRWPAFPARPGPGQV